MGKWVDDEWIGWEWKIRTCKTLISVSETVDNWDKGIWVRGDYVRGIVLGSVSIGIVTMWWK